MGQIACKNNCKVSECPLKFWKWWSHVWILHWVVQSCLSSVLWINFFFNDYYESSAWRCISGVTRKEKIYCCTTRWGNKKIFSWPVEHTFIKLVVCLLCSTKATIIIVYLYNSGLWAGYIWRICPETELNCGPFLIFWNICHCLFWYYYTKQCPIWNIALT